jgi:hypothetical protein
VWEPPTGEDDFGLSSFKRREKDTWAHLLRKRRTMFHSTLLHWWQLQARLTEDRKRLKVNVQVVGLNAVYEALRRNKKIEVEFPGKTMRELIDTLVEEFGTNVREALLNEKGGFKVGIRILVNGVIYPVETIMRAILKAGDTLIFKAPS